MSDAPGLRSLSEFCRVGLHAPQCKIDVCECTCHDGGAGDRAPALVGGPPPNLIAEVDGR